MTIHIPVPIWSSLKTSSNTRLGSVHLVAYERIARMSESDCNAIDNMKYKLVALKLDWFLKNEENSFLRESINS